MAPVSLEAPRRMTAALLRINGYSGEEQLDRTVSALSGDDLAFDLVDIIDVGASELALIPHDMWGHALPRHVMNAGRGRDLLIGPHASTPAVRALLRAVIEQCGTPILLVSRNMMHAPARLAAGIDFGSASINALRLGHLLAPKAAIHLVHIDQRGSLADSGAMERRGGTDALLNGVVTHLGMQRTRIVYAHLSDSNPAALVRYAHSHDIGCVTVGTHGPQTENGMRAGGVADALLGASDITVLIAPPKGDHAL